MMYIIDEQIDGVLLDTSQNKGKKQKGVRGKG